MIYPIQEFPRFFPTIIYCIFLLHFFPLLDRIISTLDDKFGGLRTVQREGHYNNTQHKLKIYRLWPCTQPQQPPHQMRSIFTKVHLWTLSLKCFFILPLFGLHSWLPELRNSEQKESNFELPSKFTLLVHSYLTFSHCLFTYSCTDIPNKKKAGKRCASLV